MENNNPKPEPIQKEPEPKATATEEHIIPKIEADASAAKDNNLFKKIGEFFK